ncbi:MAG TPA: hypothetical protein VFJ85_17660 [Acidimicrobiales bacterium]|nr:hypothetical protein [Acidimicrobiales bacterium]
MAVGRVSSRAVALVLALAAGLLGAGGIGALALVRERPATTQVRAAAGPVAAVDGQADVDVGVGVVPDDPTTTVTTTTTRPPSTTTTTRPRPRPTVPTVPPLPTTVVTAVPTTPPTTVDPGVLRPGFYVVRPDGSGLVRVGDGVSVFSWSPDGTRIATASGGILRVAAADGSGEHVVPGTGDSTYDPKWSPDGKLIAYGRGGALYTVAADGQASPTLVDARAGYHAWAPDGRLSAMRDGSLVVYQRDGTERVLATSTWEPAPSWSPDGSRVAYFTNEVMVVGADGTGGRAVTGVCCAAASPMPWSPDGRRVAVEDAGDVRLVDMDQGGMTTVAAKAASPTWSPDGRALAFVDQRPGPDGRTAGDIGMVGTGGGDRHLVVDVPPTLYAGLVAWSPSGDRLAFAVTLR